MTALGDNWGVDDKSVYSPDSDLEYGLSEPMRKLVEASKTNERAAEKLRIIENSPLDPTGKYLLIPDTDHPEWSHRVEVAYPKFNWGKNKDEEFVPTDFLVNTEVPYLAVQYFGVDPGDDVFTDQGNFILHGFDRETGDYHSLAFANSLEEAHELFNSTERNTPVPVLHYDKPVFIDIPVGELLGHKGLYAELLLKNYPSEGTGIYVWLMDEFGRCLSEGGLHYEHLIGLPDNVELISSILEDSYEDTYGHLHMFKHSELYEPETAEDLKECLEDLIDNRFIKIETANQEYQFLISPANKETVRLANGRRIHVGKDIPNETLEKYGSEFLIVGQEKGFSVTVKHARGAMTEEAEFIPLDPQKLFELMTDEDYLERCIFETKKRSPVFQDRVETGEPASFNQLLSISCQGKFNDVIYNKRKNMTGSELLRKRTQEKTVGMAP